MRKLRVLGHGRAAQAILVEAVLPDGSKQRCVEKVFAAGWLTRTIYRLSFQSPFAYQSNRDAILTCFYRRRVAAAVLAASDSEVRIASPLYVRYDEQAKAWVLAARWIKGRGIQPAAADPHRLRRWLLASKTPPALTGPGGRHPGESRSEIEGLVDTMHHLEALLGECGLVGSGWQVAPRALVSTANLLREDEHYTIIDLESGIPAVLVPKYLLAGARRAELPPFDDLDADKLRCWVEDHQRLLLFRLGVDGLQQLRDDVEQLIEHSDRWKQAELALLRRPWRLFRRGGMTAYQQQCIQHWEQTGTIDEATAKELPERRGKARLIWYAGLLPGALGRVAARAIGHREFRAKLFRCLREGAFRREQWNRRIQLRQAEWIEAKRLSPETRLKPSTFVLHGLLHRLTPRTVHRFLSDRRHRRERFRQGMLLLLSSRYQTWFGYSRIELAIDAWQGAQRLSEQEADQLRRQLSGSEVRAYVRGLGAHLALKTLMPLIAPAKYGGIAAFLASGNAWFLLPILMMPAARTAVTLASWWSTRHEHIPHSEALLTGWLPVVGSIAFPLQMFAARSELSTFLIRDAAAKLGRRVPIYGGPNSRTEIAMIRSTDALIELLDILSTTSSKLKKFPPSATRHREATIGMTVKRTGWGRWIDQLAADQIARHQQRRAEPLAWQDEIAIDQHEAA